MLGWFVLSMYAGYVEVRVCVVCVHVVGRTVREEGGEMGLGGGDCCGCEWWCYVLCLM